VTVAASLGKLTVVLVDVTGSARSLQAEPGSLQRDVFGGYHGLTPDVLGPMTLTALQSGVLAFELEAGNTVVERLLATFEVDKIIVAAVVLDVTQDTLSILGPGMQSFSRAPLLGDQGVTLETLIG